MPVGDQGQLPGQVRGVHHPGVHALTPGRRVDVRCVAGEQDPAAPVGRRRPQVAPEARQPPRIGDRDAPGCALPDLFLDLLEGRWPTATLARVGHHHAPAVSCHRQADEGPAVRPEEEVRGVFAADPVEGDVGQQEVPRVRLPDEGQAEFVPHSAVRAVAADHVTGADLRLPALGVAEGSVDAVTALADACQLSSLLDRAAELVHAGAQEALGLGLGEIQDESVARTVARHVQVEQAPVADVHPEARARCGHAR